MPHESKQPAKTLGTFAGVFTPSILTILGIILFLRLGYVTGSAGMGRALIIIAVALYLVFQNARVMREQITRDFNQQQLILARQAAAQIEAILQDIKTEVFSVRRQIENLPDTQWPEVLRAAYERLPSKGIVALGLLLPDGSMQVESGGEIAASLTPQVIQDDCLCEDPVH